MAPVRTFKVPNPTGQNPRHRMRHWPTRLLQSRRRRPPVLGIHVSAEMVKSARDQVPQATFKQIDVRDFQSAADTFDAITVYFSMIADVTQDDIRHSIQRIHSWLKPGGLFVFATVPVAGNNMEIKWMGRPVVASSLSPEEFVAWIRDVGFEIVRERESKFLPKAVEGIRGPDDVWEEPHLFVYAKKT